MHEIDPQPLLTRRRAILGGTALTLAVTGAGALGINLTDVDAAGEAGPASPSATPAGQTGSWLSLSPRDNKPLRAVLFAYDDGFRRAHLAFSNDGSTLTMARLPTHGTGIDVQVWSLEQESRIKSGTLDLGRFGAFAVGPEGVAYRDEHCIGIWRRTKPLSTSASVQCGQKNGSTTVALSDDGTRLAASVTYAPGGTGGPNRNYLDIWGVNPPELLHSTHLPYQPHTLKFSDANRILAHAGRSGEYGEAGTHPLVGFIDIAQKSTRPELTDIAADNPDRHARNVDDFDMSADGSMIAISLSDPLSNPMGNPLFDEVQVWDVNARSPITILRGKGGAVEFTRQGDLLATGTFDGYGLDIWDIRRRTARRSLNLTAAPEAARGLNGSVAFSPDGRHLAVPVGRTVQLWDVSLM
ncbi:hypothetical protein NFA_28800 [Nocardia farcinica IFM 10152]|uniref:WD40 repeat domain-containing protein n=1 Tax=Nocardia farcinica (strain IFM 10152) TaxID=247156 RepID=Q5YVR4_NOCFA|nr:hypothetical protein NFA_28800 [Nocardia farcinica IFM 10152]